MSGQLRRPADANYGCGDGGCVFGHPGGMHTNGGCKCLWYDRRDTAARLAATKGVMALRNRIERMERELARRDALLERCTAVLVRMDCDEDCASDDPDLEDEAGDPAECDCRMVDVEQLVADIAKRGEN